MGLRPIFRKDLPNDYVAYWEAKLNGKAGEKYVIISAGMYVLGHITMQPLNAAVEGAVA